MRLHSRIVAALVLVPCALATAFAARRPAVRIDYVPAYRFDQIRGFAKAMGTVGGTVAVGWDQQTSYMLVRRTQESEIEEHSRWDDVLLLRAAPRARRAAGRGAHVARVARAARRGHRPHSGRRPARIRSIGRRAVGAADREGEAPAPAAAAHRRVTRSRRQSGAGLGAKSTGHCTTCRTA